MDQLNCHQRPLYLLHPTDRRTSRDLIWGPPGESVSMATPFPHPPHGRAEIDQIIQSFNICTRHADSSASSSSLERVIQMSRRSPALNAFGRFSSLRLVHRVTMMLQLMLAGQRLLFKHRPADDNNGGAQLIINIFVDWIDWNSYAAWLARYVHVRNRFRWRIALLWRIF